jgi:hypothetical protein
VVAEEHTVDGLLEALVQWHTANDAQRVMNKEW